MAHGKIRRPRIRPEEATVQTEQKRICAGCGAENTPTAGFCWQCYQPFAPAAPRQGGQRQTAPGMPPLPNVTATVPAAASSRGRFSLVARIALGIVVAIVVSTVVRNMLAPHYHVPDTLSGQSRLHTEMAQQFEQDMADQGAKYDIDFDSAVYGTGDQPDVFLVLASGRAEQSADELFNDFLTGIESAGVTIDRGKAVTGQHADADYRCVPISARITAAACIWREDRSVGMTLDATPESGDLTSTVFAAYDATHA
jgi:ribosomal protein L40E